MGSPLSVAFVFGGIRVFAALTVAGLSELSEPALHGGLTVAPPLVPVHRREHLPRWHKRLARVCNQPCTGDGGDCLQNQPGMSINSDHANTQFPKRV